MDRSQHAVDAACRARVRIADLMVELCATSDDAETFLELLLDAACHPEVWAAFVAAYPTVGVHEFADASRWLTTQLTSTVA